MAVYTSNEKLLKYSYRELFLQKNFICFLLFFVSCLLFSNSALAMDNDLDGYRGHKWGMQIENNHDFQAISGLDDMMSNFSDPCEFKNIFTIGILRKNNAPRTLYEKIRAFRDKKETDDVAYYSYKNHLLAAMFRPRGADFSLLSTSLAEKYGKPNVKADKGRCPFWAWEGKKNIIIYSYKLGVIFYVSKQYLPLLTEDAEASSKKKASELKGKL